MKLYIAGPMRGVEDNNRTAFAMAESNLTLAGHEVFNPWHIEETFRKAYGYLPSLRETMTAGMAWIGWEAEGIAVLPHWGDSYGAKAEVAFATALGLPHDFVSEWIRKVAA